MEEHEAKALEDYRTGLRANRMYSFQRMDTLVVSVSGAGIYACLEMLKFLLNDKLFRIYISEISIPLKTAGILFAISVITNFISQWTSANANSLQLDSINAEIRDKKFSDAAKKLDASASKYNTATDLLNKSSICSMLIGLVSLMFLIPHLL